MKRFLFLVAAALCLVSCHTSRTYTSIIDEFRDAKGAEYHHVSPLLLKAVTAFIPKNDGGRIARSISSVRVLSLDDCSQSVKNRALKRVAKASDDGYEPFISSNDKDEQVRILMRADDDCIRELLIVNADHDGCNIVQVKGHIRLEDVESIVSEQVESLKK